MSSILFVFFFQAEDGIRDIGVTGVQTCALPIYASRPYLREADHLGPVSVDDFADAGARRPARAQHESRQRTLPPARGQLGRSEERRVGKECRSRWSQYH